MPHHIEVLLHETAGPVSEWQARQEREMFVPADYVLVFDALATLRPEMTSQPPRFLEWGSGFGIATLLAASLGWQARGIELQPSLVAESRRWNEVFDLTARFHEGSFFPTDPNAVEKLSLYCRQAEIIYVYPWPDQEVEIFDLFDRLAAPGAWLLTYYGVEDVRIFRKQGVFTTPEPSDTPSA
jgi:SAM-dependent methyltransferase